jgi:two-component system, LytTR family, sensor kinase
MRRRLLFWLVILAGWTLLVIVFAASSSLTFALNYQPPRWRDTLMMAAADWYVWAALTPLIAWLATRLRFSQARWWRQPILVVMGLPIAFVKVTLTRVLRGVTDRGEAYVQIDDLVIQYLIYAAIVLCTYVWLHYRAAQQRELQAARLEALLAQTRLQMLGLQLQPHFLFNTLNTIAELVHSEPAGAERMIAGLSQLLRESLHAGVVDRVPVEQELQLLDCYVEIQRARFGDRLTVDITADAEAKHALVPSLLLQPLVENSITHGIGSRSGAGRVEIVARRSGDTLSIEIRDNGRGLAAAPVREGVGLGNCRARLQALYGPGQFRLDLANREPGGAVVCITLPFQIERVPS